MSQPTNSDEIRKLLARIVKEADEAVDELKRRAREVAAADREYKLKYAQAMASIGRQAAVDGKTMTVADRQAIADELTSDERYAYKLAEGLFDSAKEASRTKRAAISALQSWVGCWKAEHDAAYYGPRTTS